MEEFPAQFEPDILVGLDYYYDVIETEGKQQLPSGLYLIPSKVGLVLGGKCQEETESRFNTNAILVNTQFDSSLPESSMYYTKADSTMQSVHTEKDFWDLELIGITDCPLMNDDDKAAIQFNETIKYEDMRYYVTWPKKTDLHNLPDNYGLSFGRFTSLTKRFKSDPDLLMKYNTIIQDQLQKGIVEKVDTSVNTSSKVHYLPHHPVITPDRTTTKVRIVFDGSSKQNANCTSLNESLYRGPVILPDLCGILIRCQETPYVLTSDVEKAFLQIGLQMNDRDLTRFLWYKNPTIPKVEGNMQVYRFTRVTFGVISSPFLLGATLKYHLQKQNTPLCQKILNNVYVDNVLIMVDSIEEGNMSYQEAKTIFTMASMNLREWTCNSKDVMNSIPKEDHAKSSTAKLLGMIWDSTLDQLKIAPLKKTPISHPTKREVLELVSTVFDPLGFLAPSIIIGKLFLKNLWQEKIAWDQVIPDKMLPEWVDLCTSLQQCGDVCFPRYIGLSGSTTQTSLISFVDASTLAFGAAVYIRIQKEDTVVTRLMFAKTRVASTGISMPRLELLAILIGTRALKFVSTQLSQCIGDMILYSDSKCALQWLVSQKPLTTFVTNRVREIVSNKDITFRYVSSLDNPADIASRGMSLPELLHTKLWWNGPPWLHNDMSQWPHVTPIITPASLQQIQSEQAKKSVSFHEMKVSSIMQSHSQIFPVENYNRFSKLLYIIVFVLRYVKVKVWSSLSIFKKGRHYDLCYVFTSINDSGLITAPEIQMAKHMITKMTQHQFFSDIFEALSQGSKQQLIQQLGLFLDNYGIIRCGGRLTHSALRYNAKFPILLPRDASFTKLLIKHIHEKHQHSGVNYTLAMIRTSYWIPQGRITVRKIISKCVTCQKHDTGPYRLPVMPSFPSSWVNPSPPFENVGLDYLGPLWIKFQGDKYKAWICLFTCLVTRAIHLEAIYDLSSQQFLNCLRRFCARRGQPKLIISDNASQFKLTSTTVNKAMRNIMIEPQVLYYCSLENIQWHFITPYAPWSGGFYERIIGMVKRCLKKSIGRMLLNHEQLETMMCETEAILNSRPLTIISDDLHSNNVLRPIDFLAPLRSLGTPQLVENIHDPDYVQKMDSQQKLLQYWQKSQKCLDFFWHEWISEYLPSLRERYQIEHNHPRIHKDIIPHENDIVLIQDDSLPRGSWQMGRINNLFPSADNKIRSAEVAMQDGKTIKRPINLLYPLEIFTTFAKKPVITTTILLSLTLLVGSSPCLNIANSKELIPLMSDKCVNKGYIIYKHSDGELCWKRQKCDNGQHLNGKGLCGQKCVCPIWAFRCSYYEGVMPKLIGNLHDILEHSKPQICSFHPSERCHISPKTVEINQVQLYNGSTYYVTDMNIKWMEPVDKKYECVGNGIRTGTDSFCQKHKCAIKGTKLCYYDQREIAMFSNIMGQVPVKAYGKVSIQVYGEIQLNSNEITCLSCSLKCITGGLQITVQTGITYVEVCSLPFCYKLSFPNITETIMFPAEVNLASHEFTMKAWSKGNMVKSLGIECEPSPFCEMITCTLCWDRIINPQCSSNLILILTFLMIYFVSITIYIALKILNLSTKMLFSSCKCLFICLKFCWRICKRAKNKTVRSTLLPLYTMVYENDDHESESHETGESTQQNSQYGTIQLSPLATEKDNPMMIKPIKQSTIKLPFMTYLTILCLSIVMAQSCSEFTSLTATQSSCLVEKDGQLICSIKQATRMSLAPQGQDACLLLKGPNEEPLGTLTIQVKKIGLICHEKTEYYTRSYVMKHQSVKRCPTAGTCDGNKCSDIHQDTKVDELSGDANNYPGFTYCTESCSGWSCGCFWATAACLFYRVYAFPASDIVCILCYILSIMDIQNSIIC